MPVMLGYEYRFPWGLHLGGDVGAVMQLFNAETEGDVFPRVRAYVGHVF